MLKFHYLQFKNYKCIYLPLKTNECNSDIYGRNIKAFQLFFFMFFLTLFATLSKRKISIKIQEDWYIGSWQKNRRDNGNEKIEDCRAKTERNMIYQGRQNTKR